MFEKLFTKQEKYGIIYMLAKASGFFSSLNYRKSSEERSLGAKRR